MLFREYYPSDLVKIEKINAQHEPVDDMKGRIDQDFIIKGVVENDQEQLIGFGGIKRIYELIMVIDPKLARSDKIAVMQELYYHGKLRSENIKLNFWHAFVTDPNFSDVLKHHYGFKPCTGEALFMRL